MKTLQNKRIRTYKKSADKIPKNRLFFEPLEERLPVSASILGLLGGVAALSETLNDVEAVSIDNSSFVAERNDASLLNAALTSETTSSFTSLEQETTLSGIDSINRNNLFEQWDETGTSEILETIAYDNVSGNALSTSATDSALLSFFNSLNSAALSQTSVEQGSSLTQRFDEELLQLNQSAASSEPLNFSAPSSSPIESVTSPVYVGITITSANTGIAAASLSTTSEIPEVETSVASQTILVGNFEQASQSYSSSNDKLFYYAALSDSNYQGAYTNQNTTYGVTPTVLVDTAYVIQNGNTATVITEIWGGPVWEPCFWSIEILNPGTYWGNFTYISDDEFWYPDSNYIENGFTWHKPTGLENDDPSIDRDFTFRFTVADMSVDLDVHIAWAEVQMQFAGDEDAGFKHTSSSDTQSTDNTVVVGQKVEAKIDYDPILTLSSISWAAPRGGSFVKDYITTNNAGTIISHATTDYYAEQFEFYYTSKNSLAPWIGETTIFTDPNGHSHTVTREATYYLETPTVVSYDAVWASWPNAPYEPPTGIRLENGVNWLSLGGYVGNVYFPGILWTANVTAPLFIGGGQINYNQQINGSYIRYYNQTSMQKGAYTNGITMLDTSFPYGCSVSVATPLIDYDEPKVLLEFPQAFNRYTAYYSFQTYLIYQPTGNDSIWVTLSVLNWGWDAMANYKLDSQSGQWKWEASGTTTGGGTVTTTSTLPTWNDNVKNYRSWVSF